MTAEQLLLGPCEDNAPSPSCIRVHGRQDLRESPPSSWCRSGRALHQGPLGAPCGRSKRTGRRGGKTARVV